MGDLLLKVIMSASSILRVLSAISAQRDIMGKTATCSAPPPQHVSAEDGVRTEELVLVYKVSKEQTVVHARSDFMEHHARPHATSRHVILNEEDATTRASASATVVAFKANHVSLVLQVLSATIAKMSVT